MTRPGAFVSLLRGINVGGRNAVPMAALRTTGEALGWSDVRTYIQSGNLVFRADAPPSALEDALERAIEREFGLVVPVIVRSSAEWHAVARENPFPEATGAEPNRVMLALSKAPPPPDIVQALQERAADGERVERSATGLWIHYPGGSGRSRVSPGVLDRFFGSAVTTRNWRTVLRIGEMLQP